MAYRGTFNRQHNAQVFAAELDLSKMTQKIKLANCFIKKIVLNYLIWFWATINPVSIVIVHSLQETHVGAIILSVCIISLPSISKSLIWVYNTWMEAVLSIVVSSLMLFFPVSLQVIFWCFNTCNTLVIFQRILCGTSRTVTGIYIPGYTCNAYSRPSSVLCNMFVGFLNKFVWSCLSIGNQWYGI